MLTIPVTAVFVGAFAVIQVALTVMVGCRRAQTGIRFFDGGDETLLRGMRAHANYTETVPIVLLAMAAAELGAVPHWARWVGGCSLLVGRLMLAAILVTRGWDTPRAIGMARTLLPTAGFGGWAVCRGLR